MPIRTLALGAGVGAAYLAAALFGFRVAFVAEQITTVWAPTGIALAALFLGGLRLWPAIWVGALLANLATNAPAWTGVVIATGNTLEAVVAVWWLRRLPGFEPTFARVADAIAFVLIAGVACTAISATLGVSTLCAAGVQSWDRFPSLWFDWWLGDALGALVVAPALLTALQHRWSRRDVARTAVWLTVTAALTHLVFGQALGGSIHPLEYTVFPIVVAAAVIGGPVLTAAIVVAVAAVAIWHTVHGAGPFSIPDTRYSLILLQSFMGVLASTSLLLAAAVAERRSTERRQQKATAALQQRQEWLSLAQRAGGVATFEWDFRNQVAHCSAEFFAIFGLPAVEGIMTGGQWGDFVHPDDRERMAQHLARALTGAEPAAADYRITAADGRTRWLNYAGQIQRTADGDRMLGTVVDITERKRLESELRHHAAELERVLESIGEGFVSFDREFRYIYVNTPAARMLGRSREELIGRIPWDIFPEETTRDSRPVLEAAMASGAPTQLEIHIAPWNRWFETRIYPSPSGLSMFFADVTARVESETALRENRDVLALAMRVGEMGAWSRNLATGEVWWSRELEEIFGLEPGGFDRTEASFFGFVHPEDQDAIRIAVGDAIRIGTDYSIEFRFRHANGDWRWMEGRGRADFGEDGAPRTLYGIGIDVTERKRAELVLRNAKLAAESANQLKDQFLATLSHELRTPLNAILGYGRMLQTGAITAGKRDQAIDVIVRNAVLQNHLVEDLLDMSRITTGKIRLDPEPVLAINVLRETLEGIRPGADAKGITLETDFDTFAGCVSADSTRLQQVFWNLLTNAVKFTPHGGRIRVGLHRRDDHVSMVVEDTGAGISPDFLPFVFDPFRQAESRVTRAHGGLGLGLAITRQLVELHGGTIHASSAGPDQGARFEVRLPCAGSTDADVRAAERVRAREQPSDGVLPALTRLKILLVDDEDDTRAMFRDALESEGADVRAVASAAAALQLTTTWMPDLLVTDLGMPTMDGYDLLAAMREKHSPTVIPAVAVSAYARLDDRSRSEAAGFQAYLAKPVDPEALVMALRRVMFSTT